MSSPAEPHPHPDAEAERLRSENMALRAEVRGLADQVVAARADRVQRIDDLAAAYRKALEVPPDATVTCATCMRLLKKQDGIATPGNWTGATDLPVPATRCAWCELIRQGMTISDLRHRIERLIREYNLPEKAPAR